MIAINCKMPLCCAFCNFNHEYVTGIRHCSILERDLLTNQLDERPEFCPLIEVEHICDKTVHSLHDVAIFSKEELDKFLHKEHAERLGHFIFEHPELLRSNLSDDYDKHTRSCTTDCYVVKINKEEKQK